MIENANKLSIVVITLNEQKNLPRLVAALPVGVEFIVLDSGSTDVSKQIVESSGGAFHTRAFDNFASQKNAAIDLATRPWILSLDADECPTKELWAEIDGFISTSPPSQALRIRRRQVFLGRKLRFGKSSDSPIRLFARGKTRFANEIHEELSIDHFQSVLTSSQHMLHYSYQSLSEYFDRFNRYTSLVARRHAALGHAVPARGSVCIRFFAEFFSRYVLRGGFFDGYEGFLFCLYGSVYSVTKYAKLIELKDSSK
jgi:glycosyltransferase involved in cell wall biosynthesis